MAVIDSHGWKRSEGAGNDFALTEKRKSSMKQAIAMLHCEAIILMAKEEWDVAATVTRDAADMMNVYAVMLEGEMTRAIYEKFSSLDTAARERYPQWVLEMAGGMINPQVWDEEESLDATR